MTEREWPHLYRVALRRIDGHESRMTVLSWLGAYKAVAMAVEAHLTDPSRADWPVYSVDVDDLGAAPTDPDGTVGHGPPGYLEDRAEF